MFSRRAAIRLLASVALALLSAGAATAQVAPTGTLYVLAIGVSEFEADPQHTLQLDRGVQFAAKDAQEIAALFQQQQGRLYRQVRSVTLTNANATRSNIERALASLRGVVRPGDGVIVFAAGHGGTGSSGYQFVPYDFRPGRPETLVPGASFQNVLAQLPGTRMLFLDTCHAGAAAAGLTAGSQQPFGPLAAEGGVVVFASCRGHEAAVEYANLRNGLFTHALKRGLAGEADANHDGIVTLAELDAFVDNLVRAISGNRQQPTMQRPAAIPSGCPLAQATAPGVAPASPALSLAAPAPSVAIGPSHP